MRWRGPIVVAGAALIVLIGTLPLRRPEIDVVPDLIGLPQVYHRDVRGWEGWYFTGPAKTSDVVDRLKATLLPRGWHYGQTPRGEDQFSYSPPLPLGGLLTIFTPWRGRDRNHGSISFTVLSGRVMPESPTRPLEGDWTTVMMDSMHVGDYSGPGPYPMWPIVRNQEDNALANVPRGEERNLAEIVGLPPVVHRSTFGTPWWVFSGPESRATVEARVANALTGRRGWRPVVTSGIRNGSEFRETNWSYELTFPRPAKSLTDYRVLSLNFYDGKATSAQSIVPPARSWTTVVVVARVAGGIDDPAQAWHASQWR